MSEPTPYPLETAIGQGQSVIDILLLKSEMLQVKKDLDRHERCLYTHNGNIGVEERTRNWVKWRNALVGISSALALAMFGQFVGWWEASTREAKQQEARQAQIIQQLQEQARLQQQQNATLERQMEQQRIHFEELLKEVRRRVMEGRGQP